MSRVLWVLFEVAAFWWLLGSTFAKVATIRQPRWAALWAVGAVLAAVNLVALRWTP